MCEWVDIKGYEGRYQISNYGEVVNLKTGKILKPGIGKGRNGYLLVSLWKNKKGTTKYIHRILAENFIPNPNNLPTVNHKDGDKLNNKLPNLEWTSYSGNNKHAYDTRLKMVSDKVRKIARERALKRNKDKIRSIPVVEIDGNNTIISEYSSIREASISCNIDEHYISKVCRGIKKTVKKRYFMFKEDYSKCQI